MQHQLIKELATIITQPSIMRLLLSALLLVCCVASAFGVEVEAVLNIKENKNKEESLTSNVTDTADRLAARAESVAPGEYPYQVSIQMYGQHTCGGSLISETHVLTAGHCIEDFHKNPYMDMNAMTVEVGTVTIGSGQSYRVRRLACMKGFTSEQVTPFFIPNDVAVITLQQRVTGSNNVKIISLPSSDPPVGARVVVTGFGNARFGGPTSPILRKTQLNIVSTQECDTYYASQTKLRVTGNHICARRGSGYGTCQGDSGGPMMYNRQIVGLVSGGTGRCGEGGPDVFTRVSHYLPFIKYELGNPTGSGGPSIAVEFNGGMSPDYLVYPQQNFQDLGPQLSQIPPQQYPGFYPSIGFPPGWGGLYSAPKSNETKA